MPASEEVEKYIVQLPSPQKEICRTLRELITGKFPELKEEWKWSRPVYSTADGKGVCYFVAAKEHVDLGFDYGSQLADPKQRLEGTGKNKRHVKIVSMDDVDLDYFETLLASAMTVKGDGEE